MKLYAPKDGVFAGVTFVDGQADVHHEGGIYILKTFFGCQDTPFRQAKPAQAKPAQAKPAQAKPAQDEPAQDKPAQDKPAQAEDF